MLNYLWSNGDTTLSISGLDAGTYELTVSDSVACASSFTFELEQTVSNQDYLASRMQVRLFPNPVPLGNTLSIEVTTDARGSYQVVLLNFMGQTINQTDWSIRSEVERLDLSAPVQSGYYLLQISDRNGASLVKPFVVR